MIDTPVRGPDHRNVLQLGFLAGCLGWYWIAPLGHEGWNYGGSWSLLGNGLLVALLAVLGRGVLLPLWRDLHPMLRSWRTRFLFSGLLGASFLGWLAGANVISLADPGSVGTASGEVYVAPVLTPFGAWDSLQFLVPGLQVQGYLSLEVLGTFGTLAFLWTGLTLLWVIPRWQGTPRARPGSHGRSWAGLLSWLPAGGMNACCCCTPWALVLVMGLVPGAGALPLLYGQNAQLWNGLMIMSSLALLLATRHLLQYRIHPSCGVGTSPLLSPVTVSDSPIAPGS